MFNFLGAKESFFGQALVPFLSTFPFSLLAPLAVGGGTRSQAISSRFPDPPLCIPNSQELIQLQRTDSLQTAPHGLLQLDPRHTDSTFLNQRSPGTKAKMNPSKMLC
ncbi:hypothetical protein AGIG_G5364 [Arapaima gigas]